MPRNFDQERDQRLAERRARWAEEERDRSFVLGGEVFEYSEMVSAETLDAFAEAFEAVGDMQYFHRYLAVFPQFLDDGGEARELEARWTRAKAQVEFQDVQAAATWILGEIGRRPTEAPSSSGERREESGDESTGNSSSDQAASAASTV